MKKEYSKNWKSSKQTRKQRKYLANASWKVKRKIMSSQLSEDLRKKYSRRSFPIKKGDTVKVMSGEYKGKTGKVDLFDNKKMKVTIGGVQITKKDGTKIGVKFHPSKIQIQELNLEDKKRMASLNIKMKGDKK